MPRLRKSCSCSSCGSFASSPVSGQPFRNWRTSSRNFWCSALYSSSAFHPVIEQIEHAANIKRADSAAEKYEKIGSFLDRIGCNTDEFRALLARLLSIPATGLYEEHNLGAQQYKQRLNAALCEQLVAVHQRAPELAGAVAARWGERLALVGVG